MKGKEKRQGMIREIIGGSKVSSQEELVSILEGRGMSVAQATLSRDIREMEITKYHDGKGYYYGLPRHGVQEVAPNAGATASDSIESLEFSGNLAVMKTRPGHANMVASIIDSGHVKESAGTIAGDDTIVLVLREGVPHEDAFRALGKLFKGLGKKRVN